MNKTLTYIKNFIKDRDVASITPTSIRCVKKVCQHIDFSKDLNIVEYGPGNGVFSEYILGKLTPGSKMILIEANQNFVKQLKNQIKDDRVEVHNVLAGDVKEILDEGLIGKIDYVLSGIPFSFLKPDRKLKVLQATKEILKPNGKFLAYQTSGHLKKPLMKVFGNVKTEREMLNIPPYLIYDVVKNGV